MLGDIFRPSFSSHLSISLVHGPLFSEFTFGKERSLAFTWKYFHIPEKGGGYLRHWDTGRSKLSIGAVIAYEYMGSLKTEDGKEGENTLQQTQIQLQPSSGDDATKMGERERLRRFRISKAIKGSSPWNKGRKHSAETLQRIRERTKVAMQDPKVKMKLVNKGHVQRKETRVKIRIGVQLRWQRHHEKLKLQETCYFWWQNLIAEASRKGNVGEEKHQWNSYMVLDEKIEHEWLEYIEQRKNKTRPKPRKRAPKSPEQRRKISEAISAKWSNPGYRDRVFSALAKYHRIPVGVERKLRLWPTGDKQIREVSSLNDKPSDRFDISVKSSAIRTPLPRPRRSNDPLHEDPLSSAKLEMVNNIKAQRVAGETKISEAIKQAMLLIAETEKAAKELEVAAKRNPIVRASLMETRRLTDEAIKIIKSINYEHIATDKNGKDSKYMSTRPVNRVEQGLGARSGGLNGAVKLQPLCGSRDHERFVFSNKLLPTSSNEYDSPSLVFNKQINHSNSMDQVSRSGQNRISKSKGFKTWIMEEEIPSNSSNLTKKWVNGKLIELKEGHQPRKLKRQMKYSKGGNSGHNRYGCRQCELSSFI